MKKKMTVKKIDCPYCDGSGKTMCADWFDMEVYKCSMCCGTGKMTPKKRSKYKKDGYSEKPDKNYRKFYGTHSTKNSDGTWSSHEVKLDS